MYVYTLYILYIHCTCGYTDTYMKKNTMYNIYIYIFIYLHVLHDMAIGNHHLNLAMALPIDTYQLDMFEEYELEEHVFLFRTSFKQIQDGDVQNSW